MAEDLMSKDLYEIIGTVSAASTKEIQSAYRKKALICHPDKNPGDPKAEALFKELSKVLEILLDESARAAYDKVLNARKQTKIRISQQDSKRRKLREDLEAREEAFKSSQTQTKRSDEEKLKAEIERLKKAGSKLVEEEQAFMARQIREERLREQKKDDFDGCIDTRVKLKWKVAKNDEDNGGYNEEIIHRIMSKYGDISHLVLLKEKKGSALVVFKERSAAVMAVQIEMGLATNPLTVKGLWDSKKSQKSSNDSRSINATPLTSSTIFPAANITSGRQKNTFPNFSSSPNIFSMRNSTSDRDFEDQVLSNLRRAEERRKLMEKIKAEDGDP